MAEENTETNGHHLNGLNGLDGAKKTPRRRRKAEEPVHGKIEMDFTGDLDTVVAWTKNLAQRLSAGIFALVGGLDDLEETGARWRDLTSLRRFRQIWRKTSDPLLDQAREAYDAAHEVALAARDEIEDISMDLVRHSSVLAGLELEKTGDLARLRELADEVTAIHFTTPLWNLDELQTGLEADVLVSRSMHLLILLQREARRGRKYAARCRAARALPIPRFRTEVV